MATTKRSLKRMLESYDEMMHDPVRIPKYVSCNVPIRVGQSTIKNAGRGTFVLEEVASGSLIYSIDQPFLAVLDEANLKFTCDNCFAIQADEEKGILSNVVEPVKISLCKGCKTAGYCSKKCQIEAWNHHHKLECKSLATLANFFRESESTELPHHSFRMLIRLMKAFEKNELSEDRKEAINSLEGHMEAHLNPKPPTVEQSQLKEAIEGCSSLAKAITKIDMEDAETRELYCRILNNTLSLDCQALRPPKHYNLSGDQPAHALGACLDPFVSLINHSCTPNAFWIFEGKTLRVGASRDLQPGEELTLSYRPPATFIQRQMNLKKYYKFTCTCEICRAGVDRHAELGFDLTPPMKALRRQAYDFLSKKTHDPDSLEIALAFVRLMAEAGFPEYFAPIAHLHMLIVSLCLNAESIGAASIDTTTLLRSQLKAQYLTREEGVSPKHITTDLRTSHVMQLILAYKKIVPNVFGELYPMDELDPVVLKAVKTVYWHERTELVEEIERCCGVESNLARFESERLKRDVEEAGGMEVVKAEGGEDIVTHIGFARMGLSVFAKVSAPKDEDKGKIVEEEEEEE